MTKPITLPEARDRRLLAKHHTQGIHTFSNGTAWDCWAAGNCWAPCRHYDEETAGLTCAFEAAAFMHIVTPDLARVFGWTRHEGNTQDGERFGWKPPEQCPFFREKGDDSDDSAAAPDPDPLQLVLIADPTEVIAGIEPTVEPVAVTA